MKNYLLFVLFLIGCQSSKKLSLKSFGKKYSLNLHEITIIDSKIDDGGFTVKTALFQGGETVYITDDYKNGSESLEIQQKYGNGIYTKFLTSDTLSLSGVNSKNLHWKEIKNGKIVVGYKEVQEMNRFRFDKLLKSIHIK